jgi:hypothetical protein
MPDPVTYPAATPRFGLPLLFAAQVQKEFFVNEAHLLADWLLHAAVEGETSDPPADPADGQCWLVVSPATAEWAGHEEELACYFDGQWSFVPPLDGMRVFDRSSGQFVIRNNGWVRPTRSASPVGGAVVDEEARDAIASLIGALEVAGFFSGS